MIPLLTERRIRRYAKAKRYIYTNLEDDNPYQDNLIPFINYNKPAPERSLDMLLAKYYGKSYQTEVIMKAPEQVKIPTLKSHYVNQQFSYLQMVVWFQRVILTTCLLPTPV